MTSARSVSLGSTINAQSVGARSSAVPTAAAAQSSSLLLPRPVGVRVGVGVPLLPPGVGLGLAAAPAFTLKATDVVSAPVGVSAVSRSTYGPSLSDAGFTVPRTASCTGPEPCPSVVNDDGFEPSPSSSFHPVADCNDTLPTTGVGP